MPNKRAIDVLLSTAFIEEHILAILPEEEKVTVSDSNLAAKLEQEDIPVSSALNYEDIEEVTKNILCHTGKDTEKNRK